MQRSSPMQGVVLGFLVGALLWCSGCLAYKRAYVAIHDSIDEVLGETNKTEQVIK